MVEISIRNIFFTLSCIFLYLLIYLLTSTCLFPKLSFYDCNKYDSIGSVSINKLRYEPIDVVYTWVNGTDPRWKKKKEYYHKLWIRQSNKISKIKKETIDYVDQYQENYDDDEDDYLETMDRGNTDNRFRDNEELRYSLRSIEKFAPWIRHVYIVTDGQIPSWLNIDSPRLTIVPHSDIFTNKTDLPVFSSPAIETNLINIPNLSDLFLYFNDDVFLGAPVYPEDFLSVTGIQKIYLSWEVPDCTSECRETWLNDGFCDQNCNVSACDYDMGDCGCHYVNKNGKKFNFLTDEESVLICENTKKNENENSVSHDNPMYYCNENCYYGNIGDYLCQESCNVSSCGYDAGDCRLQDTFRLPLINITFSDKNKVLNNDLVTFNKEYFIDNLYDERVSCRNDNNNNTFIIVPTNVSSFLINISSLYNNNYNIKKITYDNHMIFPEVIYIEENSTLVVIVNRTMNTTGNNNINKTATFLIEENKDEDRRNILFHILYFGLKNEIVNLDEDDFVKGYYNIINKTYTSSINGKLIYNQHSVRNVSIQLQNLDNNIFNKNKDYQNLKFNVLMSSHNDIYDEFNSVKLSLFLESSDGGQVNKTFFSFISTENDNKKIIENTIYSEDIDRYNSDYERISDLNENIEHNNIFYGNNEMNDEKSALDYFCNNIKQKDNTVQNDTFDKEKIDINMLHTNCNNYDHLPDLLFTKDMNNNFDIQFNLSLSDFVQSNDTSYSKFNQINKIQNDKNKQLLYKQRIFNELFKKKFTNDSLDKSQSNNSNSKRLFLNQNNEIDKDSLQNDKILWGYICLDFNSNNIMNILQCIDILLLINYNASCTNIFIIKNLSNNKNSSINQVSRNCSVFINKIIPVLYSEKHSKSYQAVLPFYHFWKFPINFKNCILFSDNSTSFNITNYNISANNNLPSLDEEEKKELIKNKESCIEKIRKINQNKKNIINNNNNIILNYYYYFINKFIFNYLEERNESEDLSIDICNNISTLIGTNNNNNNDQDTDKKDHLSDDTFGDSLRFVNRLYNRVFGKQKYGTSSNNYNNYYIKRRVPSHMPHLINKNIIRELHNQWPKLFRATSSHRFRHPKDMQFSFSYFYYLINRHLIHYNKNKTDVLHTIFNTYIDINKDGIMDDNEILTLASLAMGDFPTKEFVAEVTECLVNTSIGITSSNSYQTLSSTKKIKEYNTIYGKIHQEETLKPFITYDTLIDLENMVKSGPTDICSNLNLTDKLIKNIRKDRSFNYEIMSTENEITFHMLSDNYLIAWNQLQGTRGKRTKFICINDDMKYPNAYISNILNDLYISIWPKKSQFELPFHLKNIFTHLDEYNKAKRQKKNHILIITFLLLFFILVVICLLYFI